MTVNVKALVLITLAVVALAALAFVNLAQVRDTGGSSYSAATGPDREET